MAGKKFNLDDLDPDLQEIIQPHIVDNEASLERISLALCARREEAKTDRQHIEATWRMCEEAYIGIDDANRHEFADGKWQKPTSPDGPVTTGRNKRRGSKTDKKSTLFLRLTSRYVDAGTAKLGEILLPPDGKAFKLSATPDPDLIKAKDNKSPVLMDHMPGSPPAMRPLQPGETPPPQTGQPALSPVLPGAAAPPVAAPPGLAGPLPGGAVVPPAAPPMVPVTVADLAREKDKFADDLAKKAETKIYDWQVECQYNAQMRKVIFDSGRLGVGVLKGPFPKKKRGIAVSKNAAGAVEIKVKKTVQPASVWIDPWNIFPDGACGENIHEGDFIFERDWLTPRLVRELKDLPGYINSQIDKVLLAGPDKNATGSTEQGTPQGNRTSTQQHKGRFEVWYYYGSLKREEFEFLEQAGNKDGSKTDLKPDQTEVYVIATVINTEVVRVTVNPLDSGSFPYHSVPWQRRSGSWAGVGIAEQLVAPQRMLNGANRAMMNNAGKSAGSQIVIRQETLLPADDDYAIVPDKVWFDVGDANGQSVNDSFAIHEIPNRTTELMVIVNFARQLAEESTSIPLVTQGQTGPTTPDTYGATQLQNSNAEQLLRSIGYTFDDNITDPHTRMYYEWYLLDENIPESDKGDFQIDAHGSAALVERAIQDQTLGQILGVSKDPAYGADPKKTFALFLKSKRLSPQDVQYDEDKQKQMDAAPPPEAPQVTVAKINADTEMKKLAATQSADMRTEANETDIKRAALTLEGQTVHNDAAKIAADERRVAAENTVALHKIQAETQRYLLQYATQRHITLDKAKADLAKAAMQLQTEERLNAVNNAIDVHKHHNPPPPPAGGGKRIRPQRPPVQAPGRAGPGNGFNQAP